MHPRSILFLLTQSLDYPSGLGRYWPLARQLARMGYSVEIAALHPAWHALPSHSFTADRVSVRYVGQMHVRQEGNRRLYFSPPQLLAVSLAASWALTRAALASTSNIIQLAKAQPFNGLAGLLGARLRRTRLYLDCDDYEAESNRFSAAWQKHWVAGWEDRLPGAARGVTANTTFLRDRCIRLGVPDERVKLIPNGFDPERFQATSRAEVEAVRQRWSLGDSPTVLYLGSLSLVNHPILLLLDAFVQVQKRSSSARLLIVGGGEDYDRVAEAIRERVLESAVVLAGRVDPALAPAIYRACQVVVDPVLDDDTARARSPLKLVEALACGVPVVTGNVGDRAEMLGGGEAGVLVAPGDVDALANGLGAILTDTAYRNRLAKQAAGLSKRFSWSTLAREFAQIYES